MSKGKWKKHGTWVNLCPLRPENHLLGDCTTRALSYALDLPYNVIRGLQYRLAARYNSRFNMTSISNRLLSLFNYRHFPMVRKMDCGEFAEYALSRGYIYPIVVRSSGHLSIADDGCIVDTWDSRSKRVKEFWVRCDDGKIPFTWRV